MSRTTKRWLFQLQLLLALLALASFVFYQQVGLAGGGNAPAPDPRQQQVSAPFWRGPFRSHRVPFGF